VTNPDLKQQARRVAEALVAHPNLCQEVLEILEKSWIPYAGPWVMTGADGRWCRRGVFKDRMAATWPKKATGTFGWGVATEFRIKDMDGLPAEFGVVGEAPTIGEAANAADEALLEWEVSFPGCETPFVPTVGPWSQRVDDSSGTLFRLALPDRDRRVAAVGRDNGGLWGIILGDANQPMLTARYADPHDAMKAADATLIHEREVLYPTDRISELEDRLE